MGNLLKMVRDHNLAGNLDTPSTLAALRREWTVIAGLAFLFVAAGGSLLHMLWEPIYACRWVLLATVVVLYELHYLWRHLSENRLSDETPLLPSLGAGNRISLLRGLFLGGVAGLLFSPWPGGWMAWLPAGLYTGAALADLVDGHVARRTNTVTMLGGALDMEYDALGILIAPGLAMWYGQLPIWYLFVSLARYLFTAGVWLHRQSGKKVHDLTPSTFRRMSAGLVMSITSVALWPLLPAEGLWIVTTIFMLPFTSGFIRDYLVAVGVISPESNWYRNAITTCMAICTDWLPPVWRGITVSAALIMIYQQATQFPDPVTVTFSALQLLATLAVATGFGGRTACMALLLFTGLTIPSMGLDLARLAILIAGSPIILLGSGRWSIWSPEDRLWEFPVRAEL